jgi:hypothetical protein
MLAFQAGGSMVRFAEAVWIIAYETEIYDAASIFLRIVRALRHY